MVVPLYLYRAIDKDGATLDFYLAERRNAKAAKRFLSAALKRSRDWMPRGGAETISTERMEVNEVVVRPTRLAGSQWCYYRVPSP